MDEPPQQPQNASVQEQIDRLEAMIAEGREAMAKLDQFYREHDFVPGFGEAALLSDAVPDRHRAIFAKLLAEFDSIDKRIEEFDPSNARPAPRPVAARAVGNRYRI